MFADLVLEGGGVKGIALVGAISVLEERGYQFRRVAGTSAGAIVGSLVAAGARAAELEEIMRGVDYRRFRDGPRWRDLFLGKAAALMFRQGIYEGQFVKDWLGERLARLGVNTFADLRYDDPGRPPHPEYAYRLVVMTCDISQGCFAAAAVGVRLLRPASRQPAGGRCGPRVGVDSVFLQAGPADGRRWSGLLAGRWRGAVAFFHRRVRRPVRA